MSPTHLDLCCQFQDHNYSSYSLQWPLIASQLPACLSSSCVLLAWPFPVCSDCGCTISRLCVSKFQQPTAYPPSEPPGVVNDAGVCPLAGSSCVGGVFLGARSPRSTPRLGDASPAAGVAGAAIGAIGRGWESCIYDPGVCAVVAAMPKREENAKTQGAFL